VRLDGPARREAISLDPQGEAIADPHGLALTSDENRLVVSASGTHELLVYRATDLPFQDYGGTDHIPPELLQDGDRFTRIDLGGRPMGLRIAPDDRTVFVANYLENSIQVVDLQERRLVRAISLGSADPPSLARRGEAIFYDAQRSLDQWYSCHTCHYEGGGNSVVMDTRNDETSFTFKTVLPLFNVAETGPWTWHGWQEDLPAAMKKSVTSTMLGPEPSDDDAAALVAYLKSIRPPPNPFRQPDGSLNEAAQRGEQIFQSAQANCTACHTGSFFTDGEVHDVGTGGPDDRLKGYNTPSLVGVYRKAELLHDGRAKSLAELLAGPHRPSLVSGEKDFSDEQIHDLSEYLKSL
jgi:cytochrome c peroxidase